MDHHSLTLDTFRHAMDVAPLGFCVVNGVDHRVSYANPNFSAILTIEHNIQGKRMADLIPEEFINYLFGHGLISFEREMTVTRADGSSRWIKVMGEHLRSDGEYCYALWIVDITNDKKTAAQLTNALNDADAIAEMKSNLLATMSHEIRTPMQAVYGFMEMIGEISKNQKAITDMVDGAKTAASGLLEILDDVLDLAKLDAAKMELDSFEVPLRTLARGTIEAIAARSHGNITLLDDIDEDVPFVVRGDPKRLRQILLNFMTNAVKFTKNGTVTLRISTKTQQLEKANDAEDDYVGLRVEVVDTGMGMPQDVCDRLFTPFTQADNSTTRQFGGTGLGLSICKKLVELMDGCLGVYSTQGEGSTFWFEFPTVAVGKNTAVDVLPSLEGLALLVVEDHPKGIKEIQNSLRSMGAEVEACESYQDALELLKRRPFNVGVIDQGLPDGLGIDLMKEITEIRPSMGLVMYTVRDDYGLQHTIRSMGATYLAKPASRVGLGEAVKGAATHEVQIEVKGSRRVLIAEDNDSVRDILGRQLDMLGADVVFVENGVKAYDKLQEEDFGLLITDLHMPELDGYGLVHKIRAEEEFNNIDATEAFPIIVLTADVQMAQRQAYLSEGFDECLLKPVSMGQLRQLLLRWNMLVEDEVVEKINDAGTASSSQEQKNDDTADVLSSTSLPAAVDLNAMKEQMGSVDADTIDMMGMFAELTQPLIDEIRQAFDDNEAKALEEAAHSLKGSSRSACCLVLGDFASDLQDTASDIHACATLVEQIEAEFARVQAEIAQLKLQYNVT